jgi:hypothetical protein
MSLSLAPQTGEITYLCKCMQLPKCENVNVIDFQSDYQ